MKGNHFLTSSVLLISFVGLLTLTPSAYVHCQHFYPDEFLDLGLAYQPPNLLVPSFSLNPHPLLHFFLKTLYFQRVNLLTTFMRC
jgi:hypothetical protein